MVTIILYLLMLNVNLRNKMEENNYIVIRYNVFDNKLTTRHVKACDKVEAVKFVLLNRETEEYDGLKEWVEGLPNDYDKLVEELYSVEMPVSCLKVNGLIEELELENKK